MSKETPAFKRNEKLPKRGRPFDPNSNGKAYILIGKAYRKWLVKNDLDPGTIVGKDNLYVREKAVGKMEEEIDEINNHENWLQ